MVVTAVGSLILVAAPTWWLLTRTTMSDGAAVANVLALPFGIIGAVAAVYGLRSRPPANDGGLMRQQARALTSAVATAEARALMQLLGDNGEPRPADVGYSQLDASLVRWRSDGGDRTGSLATVAGYYNSLQRGRLVVLGEGGAGKTVVVLRLLLDLAAAILDGPSDVPVKVPIRLSLSSFRTSVTTVGEARVELDKWIADHLVSVHNVHPATASALIAGGWILPILDGLDEMDPEEAVPNRASQVIDGLNLPVGPAPTAVVLSCRTVRYQQLADDESSGEPLQDATAIVLQPLDVEQVGAWLHHRLPHPDQRARWRPVLSSLRAHPNGRLARCLSSPLRLYLALTVYDRVGTKPQVLCGLKSGELDPHLFARFIPALAAHHPRGNGAHYEPAAVERWLRTLARHLARSEQTGGSASEFTIEELWRSDGDPPGRGIRERAVILIILVFWLLWSLDFLLVVGVQAPFPAKAANLVGGLVVLLYNVRIARSPEPRQPVRVDLRQIRSPQTRHRLRSNARDGIRIGPPVGIIFVTLLFSLSPEARSGEAGLVVTVISIALLGMLLGVVMGPLLAMLGGFVGGLQAIHDSATKPSEPHQQARRAILLVAAPGGFILGLIQSATDGLASGIVFGLVFGSTLGFTVTRASGWYVQHRLYSRRGSRTGELPNDLSEFLDWAYQAGLLRLSGSSTEFRHREVQLHFTPPSPTDGEPT
ncbi:hypothetical protein OG558_23970 [Kribbella sp. NBC_01510]|uniref:NACHT domain-containing protein n=1 Tax=Kribbella sp. NBC_01510 TaxID=2903581 RepID=UPI003862DA1B